MKDVWWHRWMHHNQRVSRTLSGDIFVHACFERQDWDAELSVCVCVCGFFPPLPLSWRQLAYLWRTKQNVKHEIVSGHTLLTHRASQGKVAPRCFHLMIFSPLFSGLHSKKLICQTWEKRGENRGGVAALDITGTNDRSVNWKTDRQTPKWSQLATQICVTAALSIFLHLEVRRRRDGVNDRESVRLEEMKGREEKKRH